LGKYRQNMQRSLNTTVTGVVILAAPAGLGAGQRHAHAAHNADIHLMPIGGGFHRASAPARALEPERIA
jgi:hypothetical protein